MTGRRPKATHGFAARALFCAALALAGCAQPARRTFDLAGASAGARAMPLISGAALIVREPGAVAPTNSERVVVRDMDGSVSALPGVQWSERLPRLLQNRLIEAAQRAGVPAAQISPGAAIALATDIRRFEIDVARNAAVVEIEARLVDDRTGATRAAQLFTTEAPSAEHTGAPAVLALGEAFATAAARIASWARARF